MKLEWYQLAESVIAITSKRKASDMDSSSRKHSFQKHPPEKSSPQQFEYLIEFDKSTGWKPMWLDYCSLGRLSKMREELLPQFSPAWGPMDLPHSQSSREFGSTARKSRSLRSLRITVEPKVTKALSHDSVPKPSGHKSLSASKGHFKPVKQLWSLLEESTMGRRINFETHALCHHCKRIKPITTDLTRCKYSSQKKGLIVPNCLTINGCSLYNSNPFFCESEFLVDVNVKHLEETLKGDECPNGATKNIKCNRYFCRSCLKQCYDLDPKQLGKNWICPFCDVLMVE